MCHLDWAHRALYSCEPWAHESELERITKMINLILLNGNFRSVRDAVAYWMCFRMYANEMRWNNKLTTAEYMIRHIFIYMSPLHHRKWIEFIIDKFYLLFHRSTISFCKNAYVSSNKSIDERRCKIWSLEVGPTGHGIPLNAALLTEHIKWNGMSFVISLNFN